MFAFSPEIVLRDISIRCCVAWRSSLSFTLIVEDSDSLNTMARHRKKTAKKMKGALLKPALMSNPHHTLSYWKRRLHALQRIISSLKVTEPLRQDMESMLGVLSANDYGGQNETGYVENEAGPIFHGINDANVTFDWALHRLQDEVVAVEKRIACMKSLPRRKDTQRRIAIKWAMKATKKATMKAMRSSEGEMSGESDEATMKASRRKK